jgi:hypothetical protein
MPENEIYTVQVWGELDGGKVFEPSFQTESAHHAVALAMKALKGLGVALDDGVRLSATVSADPNGATELLHARDIRWWLKQPAQVGFVEAHALSSV